MSEDNRTEINKALNLFTVDQVDVLLSGLISLEGAFIAVKQPVPKIIGELRIGLTEAMQGITVMPKRELTTKEAAEQLRCSVRHVRHLGKQGRISLVMHGDVGRGRSSIYVAQSVEAYAVERQRRRQDHDES